MITDLNHIFDQAMSFTLLLAPPAWGKGHLILELAKSGRTAFYLAPLQAIGAEFATSATRHGLATVQICSSDDSLDNLDRLAKGGVIICDVEQFSSRVLEWLELRAQAPLIVLDELHLFLYWGVTFRPKLLEIYQDVMVSSVPVFALSASFIKGQLKELKRDFALVTRIPLIIDLGNMKLEHLPTRQFRYYHWMRGRFNRYFYYHLASKRSGTTLYFCRYRQQVARLVEYYQSIGHQVVGCVGGQGREFQQHLSQMDGAPDCIFATTALSHGVNLPPISDIFISYPVENPAMLLQMVGRGGRKKDSYNLYSFNQTSLIRSIGPQPGLVALLLLDLWILLLLYFGIISRPRY
ncbi:MAG: hypothetical protein HN353_08505 [Bdellovibrionales bacterium]|nr:hypothetical protein [Bdellovibrionales bacterium]MBT3526863.1 hypothetical protein [Bdellovibrionales bacterium]